MFSQHSCFFDTQTMENCFLTILLIRETHLKVVPIGVRNVTGHLACMTHSVNSQLVRGSRTLWTWAYKWVWRVHTCSIASDVQEPHTGWEHLGYKYKYGSAVLQTSVAHVLKSHTSYSPRLLPVMYVPSAKKTWAVWRSGYIATVAQPSFSTSTIRSFADGGAPENVNHTRTQVSCKMLHVSMLMRLTDCLCSRV